EIRAGKGTGGASYQGKKARSGLGRTAYEIPRRRETGDHPAGRAIPTAGTPHLGETWHSAGDLLPLVRPLQTWWAGSLDRPLAAAGPRLEPHSGRRARQPHPARTRPAGAVAA